MANAPRDENRVTSLLGVSNVDLRTPVDIQADPATHELLVKANVSGTVTANAGTNLNTSALALENGNLSSIELLTEAIQELIQRLMPLGGAITAGGSYLRVTQTAVPSTAVTGPITSAQSIAEKAVGGISYTDTVAIRNNTAIQSNVVNCIGA